MYAGRWLWLKVRELGRLTPMDDRLYDALHSLVEACVKQGIYLSVSDDAGLAEGLRELGGRFLGASLMLAGLRMCPLRQPIKPPTVALYALAILTGGLSPGFREAYEGVLEPSLDEPVELRVERLLARLRCENDDEWLTWGHLGLECSKGRALWYLEYLEDKVLEGRHLVYWVRLRYNGNWEKAYTTDYDEVKDYYEYLKRLNPLKARELIQRYPELERSRATNLDAPELMRGASSTINHQGDEAGVLTGELAGVLERAVPGEVSGKCRQILELLNRHGALSCSRLASELGVSKRWLVQLVKRLKAMGLVEAKERVPGVRLTERGGAVLKRLRGGGG